MATSEVKKMEIVNVCVVSQQGGRCYKLGESVGSSGRKIARFERHFAEYPDHTDYYIAAKDAEGCILVEFVGCPMVVEYGHK